MVYWATYLYTLHNNNCYIRLVLVSQHCLQQGCSEGQQRWDLDSALFQNIYKHLYLKNKLEKSLRIEPRTYAWHYIQHPYPYTTAVKLTALALKINTTWKHGKAVAQVLKVACKLMTRSKSASYFYVDLSNNDPLTYLYANYMHKKQWRSMA